MGIKKTVVLCVIATMGLFTISGPVRAADPVSLNITGNIIASPCQVSSDSISKAVDLGQSIQASTLQTPSSASEWVYFDINLESCPSGTTQATMTMHGDADSANPDDLYQNTGSAVNIAVQLQSQNGDPLGNGKIITGLITNNTYAYKLRARAFSPIGGVKPGKISSVVTATFVYQ